MTSFLLLVTGYLSLYNSLMSKYEPIAAEKKWREFWAENKTFRVDLEKASKPYYNLMMFPYPSGEGLHVGHVYAFGGADTYGRFQRMQGQDIFEPMGFDAFGIHSENFAIKKNLHPKKLIEETTRYFREEQLEKLGALFDWDHSVTTSDPKYYRWTQWLFLRLYRAKLAIKKEAPVAWCPSCKTVLADEQVISGHCERCNSEVIQKFLSQWFFKITDYAERLLGNLEELDWSPTTLEMQKNWIGKSEGVEVSFDVIASNAKQSQPKGIATSPAAPRNDNVIKVFTTRPDTLFGVTFMVLAPEHPIVASLLNLKIKDQNSKIDELREYIKSVQNKSEVDRLSTVKEKTGVFTGLYGVNPVNQKEIPIYVADYVLMSYGTGAVMGVPAHDQRDYEFATKYQIDIVQVIRPEDQKSKIKNQNFEIERAGGAGGKVPDSAQTNNVSEHWREGQPATGPAGGLAEAFVEPGVMVNSGEFDGQKSEDAKKTIANYIESNHLGSIKTNYHLRDWLISRQRYWGPPIPIIYCRSCWEKEVNSSKLTVQSLIKGWDYTEIEGVAYMIRPVPEKDLPVLLPEVVDFKPLGTGKSPLATVKSFVKATCPECGSEGVRETDVSDTFLDSSWYFLRYPSVGNENLPFDKQVTKKWLPVDMYIGGNEHAVLHLLYSRFVTMALHDAGDIDFEEPFTRFRAHGLIVHNGAKMSKSRGNVINPNEFIDKYGADTLRMYLLFLGPYEQGGDFSVRGIGGISRFLQRIWILVEGNSTNETGSAKDSEARKNLVIQKMTDDLSKFRFNTAIATLMEYLNFLTKKGATQEELKTILILLAPLAPFFTEEAWQRLSGKWKGESGELELSIHNQPWPQVDEASLKKEEVTLVIQVNGKVRDRVTVPNELPEEDVVRLALDAQNIKKYIGDRKIKKTIFLRGKLINFVV